MRLVGGTVVVRIFIPTTLLATALVSIWTGRILLLRYRGAWFLVAAALSAWVNPSWGGWQSFRSSPGLPLDSVTCMLADRSGDYWFGTSGSGVIRYDGARWITFKMADGLAGDHVTSIIQDRSGNLWVGCVPNDLGAGGGASRFDGSTWVTFTASEGLADNYTTALLEDRDGNLWFGTYLGNVSKYDGTSWSTFSLGSVTGRVYSGVLDIMEDHGGNLWFASGLWHQPTNGGLARFDGTTWTAFTTAEGLALDFVSSIVEDASGTVWCTYGGALISGLGLGRFDGTRWTSIIDYDNLGNNDFVAGFLDHKNYLWFGTTSWGALRYDGTIRRPFTTGDGLASNNVGAIMEDTVGNLWFATTQGLSRYDRTSWKAEDAIGDPILEDRAGTLWAGSFGAGVSRLVEERWKRYAASNGLGSNYVTALLEDRVGSIWVGTWDGGVSRFDGTIWRTFTVADGLAANAVLSLLEDRSGNVWAGTYDGGVSRFDGTTWVTYRKADGLGGSIIESMLLDDAGAIWFVSNVSFADTVGLTRYDGSTWRTFTTADGLSSNSVSSLFKDRSGRIWATTSTGEAGSGVCRFDGSTWRTFSTSDGLVSDNVTAMYQDRSGSLWFLSTHGMSRFNEAIWKSYTVADGLASDRVNAMLEDRDGVYWFATDAGVSRFDGALWRTFNSSNGLPWVPVRHLLEDRVGDLWFTTDFFLTHHVPDQVRPLATFLSTPFPISSSRLQTAVFAAAFGEVEGIEFSSRLDGGLWSDWNPLGSRILDGIPDGAHTLDVRARDFVGNVSPSRSVSFQVDATPPSPILTSPAFGTVVRSGVSVRGSADDPRLQEYRVEVRPAGAASWDPSIATLLAHSSVSVRDGPLAAWDTSPLADGLYDLRLSASDSLGLTGSAQVTVIVDNHAPFADVTAPVVVSASTGGNVFTTGAEAHLYFPPHAFSNDVVVTVTPAVDPSVPIPPGTTQVLGGFDIAWGGAPLRKPARLEFAYATSGAGSAVASTIGSTVGADAPKVPQAPEHLAVYRSLEGSWERVGGTTDPGAGRISLAITTPGIYALFVETGVISGSGSLSGLAFTPRVFSPTGSFADREVAISFTLGRPAPVTVRVYSRSGRLIREVVAGQTMNAGANLVRWDGRDRNGGYAVDGMYLVTVEALGRTERKTLAVVK